MAIGTSLGTFFPDTMSFMTQAPVTPVVGVGELGVPLLRHKIKPTSPGFMGGPTIINQLLGEEKKPLSDKELEDIVKEPAKQPGALVPEAQASPSPDDADEAEMKKGFTPYPNFRKQTKDFSIGKEVKSQKGFEGHAMDIDANEYYDSHPNEKSPTQAETNAAAMAAVRANTREGMYDTAESGPLFKDKWDDRGFPAVQEDINQYIDNPKLIEGLINKSVNMKVFDPRFNKDLSQAK